MYAFELHQPKTLNDAVTLLGQGDVKPLAGGQTLVATLKTRLAFAEQLVDLGGIPELRGIRRDGDMIVIGATTRHAEVAKSDLVQQAIPGLASLAGQIGDPQVRNLGTLGGSVANSDPAACYPAAVLGLGATVCTNRRQIAADDFFLGLYQTALEEGELITEIRFPVASRSAYEKFRNPASHFALAGVFVSQRDGDKQVRVAVTGCGPCVFRATAIEDALGRDYRPEVAKGVTLSPQGLNTDLHASAEYRAHLIPVLAARAVAQTLA
ncbi:FAD binding domain-containing protein [Noviherbaspirillum galbum]|uniref:Xanthine dehydrogenase family protein subunit M n=1 Tax=Noviherbaspirillum galbum TaxID=2709383 RepID=A0A6B3ST59_9BURK|nr:xanthine dehydrogenase family protein subunit M [Noviherbaspirillum galbum]NEX64160.1 xanthine dehydrogenase family protein subunit M [Noviherbaspirillum galbum]